MSPITTHVLDTAAGRPAAGISVRLDKRAADGSFQPLASGRTDADGRCRDLLPAGAVEAGVYRLVFDTAAYLHGQGFYPEVPIVFSIAAPTEHYHVPLLLSPFGYSTYRGS
jgi:5-hydroxyisourate hydrolase